MNKLLFINKGDSFSYIVYKDLIYCFQSNWCFYQQDVASYEGDDDDDNDGVVPQRRGQVSLSQEQEDLVVKGKAFGSSVSQPVFHVFREQ